MNETYNCLCPVITNAIRTIKSNVLYSELMYLEVITRSWWHAVSRRLSRHLDFFINRCLRRRSYLRENWLHEVMHSRFDIKSELVLASMLCTDEVHLNSYSNQALATAFIQSIAQKWQNYGNNRAHQNHFQLEGNKNHGVEISRKDWHRMIFVTGYMSVYLSLLHRNVHNRFLQCRCS